MCVVSMVVDHYGEKWQRELTWPTTNPTPNWNTIPSTTQVELDKLKLQHEELKREVENMRELLKKAKLYDEVNDEPDCAKDEKIEIVKRVAAAMGVDLGDLLP